MTARKPNARKPVPRKGSKPTLANRIDGLEVTTQWNVECIAEINKRLDDYHSVREFDQDWLEELDKRLKSMEARAHFRDASHDEPASNAGEAVGQHFRILPGAPRVSWWRRFWNFMGSAS